MEPATWQERRSSFGTAAELYDRIRPHYPAAAIRWILGDGPSRVVDLGAGTGILSRQLAALGHEVIPVEPDPAMREQAVTLAERTGGPLPVGGTAEAIPLADASVDAVVAGQAYHWFEVGQAHPEIARVLRPGGVFGPLWNLRDEGVSWVAELTKLTDSAVGERPGHGSAMANPSFGPGFGPIERALFPHSTVHTATSLVELVRSRSYYLTADAGGRQSIDSLVRDLLETHPDLAGREEFELPYVTAAYRARRL